MRTNNPAENSLINFSRETPIFSNALINCCLIPMEIKLSFGIVKVIRNSGWTKRT